MAEDYKTWMQRAESSLALGLVEKTEEMFFEDLCFQLQQAVEKAIKALLVFHDIDPPITHSFVVLLKAVSQVESYSGEMEKVIELEDYSVQTRYPGDYTPVDENEYRDAVEIAKAAMEWIRRKIP